MYLSLSSSHTELVNLVNLVKAKPPQSDAVVAALPAEISARGEGRLKFL